MKPKVVIIGGGLTGLYAAYLLQEEYAVTILEARDRLGGRVLTHNGHDLGPSWFWEHHELMQALLQELGLDYFPHYTEGLAVYHAQKTELYATPATTPSFRVKGGLGKLIDALAAKLTQTTILLNSPVSAITNTPSHVEIHTQDNVYESHKVINTLPPRLAAQLSYQPRLDNTIYQQLMTTPTWMGYITKVVIEYEDAFWRNEGKSGFVFSNRGPLSEIHDACSVKPALFGFMSSRNVTEDIELRIQRQMISIFGIKAARPTDMIIQNWTEEPYTALLELDGQGLREHPMYGADLSSFNGRLYFASTESSFQEGGYLEGALHAAIDVARAIRTETI